MDSPQWGRTRERSGRREARWDGGHSLLPQEGQGTLVFCSWKTSGPVNSYVGSCNPWTSEYDPIWEQGQCRVSHSLLEGSHAGVGWAPNPMTGVPMKRDKSVVDPWRGKIASPGQGKRPGTDPVPKASEGPTLPRASVSADFQLLELRRVSC